MKDFNQNVRVCEACGGKGACKVCGGLFRKELNSRERKERRVLKNAEFVIEEQRGKIEELTNVLLKLEEESNQEKELNGLNVKRYVEENKRLRLYLDSINAEIAALSLLNENSERNICNLTNKLGEAEYTSNEKDKLIQKLQSEIDKFLLETRKLSEEIESLKSLKTDDKILTSSLHEQTPQFPIFDVLTGVQKDMEGFRFINKELEHANEELRVSKKCLIQLESDVVESQKVIEIQRKEIQRLYRLIDSMNKEKALASTVILTLSTDKTMKQNALPSYGNETTSAFNPAEISSVYTDDNYVDTTQQLKMIEENRELLTTLLKGLDNLTKRQKCLEQKYLRRCETDKSIYYRSDVLHCIKDTSKKHFKNLKDRIMEIKLNNLYLYDEPTDKLPVVHLLSHKVKHIDLNYKKFEMLLHYKQNDVKPVKIHVFKFKDLDSMERWNYAMKYAGFIMPRSSIIIESSNLSGVTNLTPIHTQRIDDSKKDDLFPKTDIDADSPRQKTLYDFFLDPEDRVKKNNSLNAKDKNKSTLIYDEASNALKVQKDSDITKINCGDCVYKPENEMNEIIITHQPNSSKQSKYIIKAKNKEDFRNAVYLLQKGTWYQDNSIPSEPKEKNVFAVRDGNLMLFANINDVEPVLLLKNVDCITKANQDNNEFVIVHKADTPDEETYVFNFLDKDVYLGWLKKLEENGFFKSKNRRKTKQMNQVGVVTKDLLELHKFYGDPDSKPFMILKADKCEVRVDKERREIDIIHHKPDQKKEKITLDCSNMPEFYRWFVALCLGGFLKDTDKEVSSIKSAYANLSKFVFPIRLFDSDNSEKLCALKVFYKNIVVTPHPNAIEPFIFFYKKHCEFQRYVQQRKIRFYIKRSTEDEERIDFIMPLAKTYDKIVKELEDCKYKLFNEYSSKKSPSYPFVLCKPGAIVVHKKKSELKPSLTLTTEDYKCNIDESTKTINFIPDAILSKKKSTTPWTICCTSKKSFQNWVLTLKLSKFVPLYHEDPPLYFLPNIIYGHINSDSATLLKESKKKFNIKNLLSPPFTERQCNSARNTEINETLRNSSSVSKKSIPININPKMNIVEDMHTGSNNESNITNNMQVENNISKELDKANLKNFKKPMNEKKNFTVSKDSSDADFLDTPLCNSESKSSVKLDNGIRRQSFHSEAYVSAFPDNKELKINLSLLKDLNSIFFLRKKKEKHVHDKSYEENKKYCNYNDDNHEKKDITKDSQDSSAISNFNQYGRCSIYSERDTVSKNETNGCTNLSSSSLFGLSGRSKTKTLSLQKLKNLFKVYNKSQRYSFLFKPTIKPPTSSIVSASNVNNNSEILCNDSTYVIPAHLWDNCFVFSENSLSPKKKSDENDVLQKVCNSYNNRLVNNIEEGSISGQEIKSEIDFKEAEINFKEAEINFKEAETEF